MGEVKANLRSRCQVEDRKLTRELIPQIPPIFRRDLFIVVLKVIVRV